jgi:pimeloyl-ACP methyl ester carboxylesterase
LTVAVPDGRVVVHEIGHGPAVVLVHGGTGTAAHDWELAVAGLREHARVVTLDLRGHGGSPNRGGALTDVRFAQDLTHVLTRLGIGQAVFIGFSLGANTVLRLITLYPSRARGAVLIGGSATGDPERIRAMKSGPWPPDLAALQHPAHPDSDHWDRLRQVLLDDWSNNTERSSAELARAALPVLVVHGERDAIQTTAAARDLVQRLPDARLEVVTEAGHAVQRDRPEEFLRLVSLFLSARCGFFEEE